MKNKGFTLIELIAILVILGILALITVPSITKHVKEARELAYKEQIERIIKATKSYVIESEEFLYKDSEVYQIKLEELRKSGYLEDEDLYSPITEEKLNGCVSVEYDEVGDKYNYTYIEVCS